MENIIGKNIRYWRKARRKSQLELALEANISTRHLSFVESGRARPSRDLIVKLAKALKLTYRQSNVLLNTAGFAAVYSESSMNEEQMEPIQKALEFMLAKHEPFPAVAVKPNYDILVANSGFRQLAERLAGKGILERYPNVYRLIFASNGLKPYFENWEIFSAALLARLHEEALVSQNARIFKLYEELKKQPTAQVLNIHADVPVVSFTLKKNEVRLELFSTLTSFSTPMNISTQEVRVESLFPLNESTRGFFASSR